jgi:uncharacterized protein YbjT (DUF2867 family)
MTTYLVAGATGRLGRPTLEELQRRGHEVRGLSRSAGTDRIGADLLAGRGLADVLRGVDVVVHAATTNGRRDLDLARKLSRAARTAGVRHLVLVSIVGVDRIPWGFYRDRLRIEEIVRESGVPFTIQRATQFHSFVVDRFLAPQRRLPTLLVPAIRLQPIAAEEVAIRLADLATGEPIGRAGDIGGPEVRTTRDLAETWARAVGLRRRALAVRTPGRVFRAFDAGANLVPGTPHGLGTFEQYLARFQRADQRPAPP